MQDERIIELFFERNENAITAVASKYGIPLEHLAERIVSVQDAEECVNDTYLKAWDHIPPSKPNYLFAWLAKVCRNLALGKIEWNGAQKRSARVVELTQEMEECLPASSIEEEADSKEVGRVLSEFLMGLPQKKRVMFMRRYWYGNTIQEISELMQCREGNVKTVLFRIRKELKAYLEKEEIWVS